MDALATLAQVKQWLNIDTVTVADDALLTRLISSASAFVLNYITIPTFAKTAYQETYDGYGNPFMVLRQSPALAVSQLSINGVLAKPAQGNGITIPYTSGYVLQGQRLNLYGSTFPRQRSSVFVNYTAGYTNSEIRSVPAATSYTIATSLVYLGDLGVTLGGTVLVAVTGAPAAMQYSVASDGTYTFNSAQANASVVISYSCVPADVTEVAIELVGERYKYRDRIGYQSKSLGGQETVTFSSNSTPKYVLELLNKYKNVIPV